jgi:hypothetical protein
MLGTGPLGANTKNWFVNLINTVSSVEYYAWQMTRMSRGEPPQTIHRNSTLGTFLWYLTTTTLKGLRRKLG